MVSPGATHPHSDAAGPDYSMASFQFR